MRTLTESEIEAEIAELTANHEQHRDWRWTQSELAGAIDDWTTVRPVRSNGRPRCWYWRTVLFKPAVAMAWHIGREIIREKGLKLDDSDPLVCCLLPHAGRLNPPNREPWPLVLHVCCLLGKGVGRSRDDVLLLGEFRGRGIIRQ